MTTERNQLDRELGWHHKEIRKLAVEGASNSGTTARIADLHERIAQAEARVGELDGLIAERKGDRLTVQDVETAFADFDTLWDSLITI
jgi:hypothetical protein